MKTEKNILMSFSQEQLRRLTIDSRGLLTLEATEGTELPMMQMRGRVTVGNGRVEVRSQETERRAYTGRTSREVARYRGAQGAAAVRVDKEGRVYFYFTADAATCRNAAALEQQVDDAICLMRYETDADFTDVSADVRKGWQAAKRAYDRAEDKRMQEIENAIVKVKTEKYKQP